MIFSIEYFLGNISFIILFIAVILYWLNLSSSNTNKKTLVYSAYEDKANDKTIEINNQSKDNKIYFIPNLCMIIANVCLSGLLLHRWIDSGHFPLSNLYESLIFLSWVLTNVHLFLIESENALVYENLEHVLPLTGKSFQMKNSKISNEGSLNASYLTYNNSVSSLSFPFQKNRNSNNVTTAYASNLNNASQAPKFHRFIGAITAPTTLLISLFATFFLPPDMLKATALIPALKSNWLMMHVTVMVASYAFLLIGSLFSIAFLVVRINRHITTSTNVTNTLQNNITLNSAQYNEYEEPSIEVWLNTTSYRILGLGFPLLTIGILSGAVWANSAWGSYWSWDPKETWALITWFVFAAYFHSRFTRNSDSSYLPASIASVGFIAIWVCYLGVNLLGSGLHSYGWFTL